MPCSTSRTGSPSTPGTSHDGPVSGSRSSSTPCRSRPVATIADLGFGEDFELLAAVADAEGLPVIGSVRSGEGVGLLRAGEPCELAGWEHFRDQK